MQATSIHVFIQPAKSNFSFLRSPLMSALLCTLSLTDPERGPYT